VSQTDRGNRFDDDVVVVRVISSNDETGWAALSVADSQGEVVTVVGSQLARYAEPQRRLHVAGRWQQHPSYGPQVSAQLIRQIMAAPDVDQDIAALLQRIPYLGTKRAQLTDRPLYPRPGDRGD